MLIQRAEVPAQGVVDVRVDGGRIVEVGSALARGASEETVEAAGGALLPGLHDHHIHLHSLAASERSVECGPPAVRDRLQLARALGEAPVVAQWIRGVGYHDSVAGVLDAGALDAIRPDAPLRIQHRSGACWSLNSLGLRRIGVLDTTRCDAPPGVERDGEGRPTGRLFGLDAWLRTRIAGSEQSLPDLKAVGLRLASYGVTGVTDATPSNDEAEIMAFITASQTGALPQRVRVMGAMGLPESDDALVERGAVKWLLREDALPSLDSLVADVRTAHANGRRVALHCVTRAELVMAATALSCAGATAGDRIEHASIAPPDLVSLVAKLPVTVVTQPGFLFDRGDAYLEEVPEVDRPWLYRCSGFLAASVRLGGSTDAPFGHADPWRAMQAAVSRTTRGGVLMDPDECLTPERALALFTTALDAPGGEPRRVAPGAPADLCLLDVPWRDARGALSSDRVAATWCRGTRVV